MGRGQFTFYRSYYEAINKLSQKDALSVLKAIMSYGLDKVVPDGMTPTQIAFFTLVKPTLDTGWKKASAGSAGGSKAKQSEANRKQTASNSKQDLSEKEKEKEKEKEIEIEDEKEKDKISSAPADTSPFDTFWNIYPCQIGREAARQAFRQAQKREEYSGQILEALKLWKLSEQWAEESGRFVPRAAKWLNEDHWKSPPSVKNAGASGILGQAELEAIQRVLQEA